jgi:Tfp pilus assembly protein PilF
MATTSPDVTGPPDGDDVERPLSVTEAVRIVMQLLQSGQVAEAETICRKILEVAPDHPDATHYLGIVEHKKGAPTRASRSFAAVSNWRPISRTGTVTRHPVAGAG